MNKAERSPLERVESTGKLNTLRQDPTKVIRSERFSDLQEMYGDTFACAELAALAKSLYDELETLYGISVPTNIVVDKDIDGEVVIGQAVDRISGVTLDEVEASPVLAIEAEKLYTSIAHYLYNKSRGDDYYLVDLNSPSQYMYGRGTDEQEPRIHLVDTDIYVNKGRESMYLVMEWLARHMSGVEHRFGSRFDEARQYLQKFVEESKSVRHIVQEAGSVKSNLDNIISYLQGGAFGPAPEKGIPDFIK